MPGNRKDAEQIILNDIAHLAGNENYTLYKTYFSGLTDDEFYKWMLDLKDGKALLSIVADPAIDAVRVDRNISYMESHGVPLTQKLRVVSADGDMPDYTPNIEYILYTQYMRKTQQTTGKGVAVSNGQPTHDLLSGQVAGKSRNAKLTTPEAYILLGIGLKLPLAELMRDRGGDLGALYGLNAEIFKHGVVSQKTLHDMYSTGTTSISTLSSYLKGMHINNTLVPPK